jgi:glycosidase
MEGAMDPGCRECMKWDEEKQDKDLFQHVKKLISLRKNHPLLANEGTLHFVPAEHHETCFSYTKSNGEKTILVVINHSTQPVRFHLPEELKGRRVKNLWTNEEYPANTEELEGRGFAMLEF